MTRAVRTAIVALATSCLLHAPASAGNGDTSWMLKAKYGIFMHYQYRILLGYSHGTAALGTKPELPPVSEMTAQGWNRFVDGFDVQGFADQMAEGQVGWVLFCIDDHYFGWPCAPNRVFDEYTGYAPGERCSRRDLIAELADALSARGVKLICYYAGLNGCMQDPKSWAGLMDDGNNMTPPSAASRKRRIEVLREFTDRYQGKVAGWWFDAVMPDSYREQPHDWWAIESVVHAANPKSVIAFSWGKNRQACMCRGVDDFTSGDSYKKQDLTRLTPKNMSAQEGLLWHGKIYCGNVYHGQGDANQFDDQELIDWIKTCNRQGGVCTLDWPFAPETGLLKDFGMAQLKRIAQAVKGTSPACSTDPAPPRLKVGVVQMAVAQTVEANRDRIVSGIARAAARGVRVTVFPEGALRGRGGNDQVLVEEAVEAVRRAARESKVYVLFGGCTYLPHLKKDANWVLVLGPDGRDLFRYEKLYDNHRAAMPGVFLIDGVPCGAMICADRWLRGVEEIPIQQGAQISFELSCNFASEWVAPYEWYWYVPRALRNNVWVIFANAGNEVSGVPDDPSNPRELRHGHSAIIAPDGRIAAAAEGDAETIVVADLDVSRATRAEAQARATNPVLRPFWEAALKLHSGQVVEAPPLAPLKSAETDITLAAAQVTGDFSDLEPWIPQACAKHADVVVFPERAVAETALAQLQAAAREHRITVVVGMEHRGNDGRRNSAFVIGPDGAVLTRYDQLSAASPFQPGDDPSAMWFRVKGVPAVVTIGRDALWTELAELAAVAGAQIHVHLEHDAADDREAALRRLQVWSNMASFETFTATVNVVGSAIWDNLRDADERRAEVRGLPRPQSGPVEVYSPFSANLVVRAGQTPQLVLATRHVGPQNRYHPRRTSSFNPQMDAWYRLGAAIIGPGGPQAP